MTKKHYEAIASIMRGHKERSGTSDYPSDAKNIVLDLADYFTIDNPKFDRARFLQACGVQQN